MSLTALMHTAPAPQPFNATFYATVATIVPVLYLALAVQGRFFEELQKTSARVRGWLGIEFRLRESKLRALAGANAVIALVAAEVLILAAGAVAEVLAIVALYQQHATAGVFVLAGAIFLAVTVIIPPAITLVQQMLLGARQAIADNRAGREARRHRPPEMGKTDPEV